MGKLLEAINRAIDRAEWWKTAILIAAGLWIGFNLFVGVDLFLRFIDLLLALSILIAMGMMVWAEYLELGTEDFPKAVQEYVAKHVGQNERPMYLKDLFIALIPGEIKDAITKLKTECGEKDWKTFMKERVGTNEVEAFGRPFVSALGAYNRTLPSYVGEKGLPALLGSIPHWKAIKEFYGAFGKYGSIYWDIWLAYNSRFHGVEESVKSKFYDWDSPTFYDNLTSGLPFGVLFNPDNEVKIEIPQKLFSEGAWVLAPRGRGKTLLLSNLLDIHLEEVLKGNASIIVMDSKGELTQLKNSARFGPGDLFGKLIFIDPWEDLALNPFDMSPSEESVITAVRYLINSLVDTDTSAKQTGILNKVVMAVMKIPDANFETMLSFLLDWKPYREHLKKLKDATFFEKGMYDLPENKKTREALYWRIDAFLDEVPRMRSMFSAKKNLVNLGPWMDAGKVIVINNHEEELKGGTTFFSRYFLMLIHSAGQARKGGEIPVYLYLDEADTVIGNDPLAAEIMNRLRSKKIGLIAAHQSISQIENEKVLAALKDSSILLANAANDAASLKHLFHCEAKDLQGLERGEFVLWLYDLPGMPIRIKLPIPGRHINTWDKMSDEDQGKLLTQMRKMFCIPLTQKKSPQPVDTAAGKWER